MTFQIAMRPTFFFIGSGKYTFDIVQLLNGEFHIFMSKNTLVHSRSKTCKNIQNCVLMSDMKFLKKYFVKKSSKSSQKRHLLSLTFFGCTCLKYFLRGLNPHTILNFYIPLLNFLEKQFRSKKRSFVFLNENTKCALQRLHIRKNVVNI